MCLLAGCDYLPNVPGLGIKTAYKLVKQHRTYKKVRGLASGEDLLRLLFPPSSGYPPPSPFPPQPNPPTQTTHNPANPS
jgi:hypothetical protein